MEHDSWFLAGPIGSFAGQTGLWKILVGLKITSLQPIRF